MRDELMRKLSIFLVLTTLCSSLFAAGPYFEGVHYHKAPAKLLQNKVVKEFAKEKESKVQVIEFFSYACGGCYHLSKHLDAWGQKLPKHVNLTLVPVCFHKAWEPLAKTYLTAD